LPPGPAMPPTRRGQVRRRRPGAKRAEATRSRAGSCTRCGRSPSAADHPRTLYRITPPASSATGPRWLSPFWLTPPHHLSFCTRSIDARSRRACRPAGVAVSSGPAAAASLLHRGGASGMKGTGEPRPEVERSEKNTLSQGSLSSRFCRHVVHGRRRDSRYRAHRARPLGARACSASQTLWRRSVAKAQRNRRCPASQWHASPRRNTLI
jgi:hypothetical protein